MTLSKSIEIRQAQTTGSVIVPACEGIGERRLALEVRVESVRKSRQCALSYGTHGHRVWSQAAQLRSPAWLVTSCVTLESRLTVLCLFPHLRNGNSANNGNTHLSHTVVVTI